MSGGHWNYLDTKLEEQGINLKETFYFLAAVEHELDWGICNDTCLDCAKLRAAEALILYFDGSVASAIATVRDRQQNQCAKERRQKAKVKCWTFEELEEDWRDWSTRVSDSDSKAALAFLGWICPRA